MVKIQEIYDQMLGLMDVVLAISKELGAIDETMKNLCAQLKAREDQKTRIQEQLRVHLQAEPQKPDGSDFLDEADYNAEMASYEKDFSAWSLKKSLMEYQLEDQNRAIFNLRYKIEQQLKKLNKITAHIQELGEQAEELDEQARTLASKATMEEYQKIKDIKGNLFEKLEAFQKAVRHILEELPAYFQTEPQKPPTRPFSLPEEASMPSPTGGLAEDD